MLEKIVNYEFGDVQAFLKQCCIFDITNKVSSRCLYESYEHFCEKNKLIPYSACKVGRLLRELGFKKSQTLINIGEDSKLLRIWIGLRLKFSHVQKEKPAPTPVKPVVRFGNAAVFVKQFCNINPQSKTSSTLLYSTYKEACLRNKPVFIPLSQQKFTQALKQAGYLYYRNRKERGFRGIELKCQQN